MRKVSIAIAAALILGAGFAQANAEVVKDSALMSVLGSGNDAVIQPKLINKTYEGTLTRGGDLFVGSFGQGVYFKCEKVSDTFTHGPVSSKITGYKTVESGESIVTLAECHNG